MLWDYIFGAGLSAINNTMAADRESTARQENYQLGEKAAQNADRRTRALYNDLYSVPAQMKQLKEAGLSPSIYASGGLSGISGQAGAQGTGASGISPTTFGIDPLTNSQIELNKAEARNLNSAADEREGGNEMGKAKITNTLQQAGLYKAEEAYKKSLEAGQNLQNYITNNTKDFRISVAYSEAEIAAHNIKTALYESLNSELKARLMDETFQDQVKNIQIKNDNMLTERMLMRMQTKLNAEQIAQIREQCKMWQNEVAQGWADIQIKAFNAQTEKERNKIIDDYFDGMVNNLEQRLEFDKNKFDREIRYQWITYGLTFLNQNMHYFGDKTLELLPTGTPKKIKGLE